MRSPDAELISTRDQLRTTNPVPLESLRGVAEQPAAQMLRHDITAGRRHPLLTAGASAADEASPVLDGASPRLREPRSVGRRWVLAGAAVAGLAGIGVLGRWPGGGGTAVARTPAVLPYALPEGAPAVDLLQQIAASAARQPQPVRAPYAYVRTNGWYLSTAVADGKVTSALASTQQEMWRTADGHGRSRQVSGPVLVDRVGSQETLDAVLGPATGGGHGEVVFGQDGSGLWPQIDVAALPWSDPQAWADTVHRHSGTGIPVPVDVVTGITTLFADQPVDPADRARVWQLLAAQPGVLDRGRISDRLGRDGRAFTLDGSMSSGPASTQFLLIVDEVSGQLLGSEEVRLVVDAVGGRLGSNGVSQRDDTAEDLPAVISLTVFVAAAWVQDDVERGGALVPGLVQDGEGQG